MRFGWKQPSALQLPTIPSSANRGGDGAPPGAPGRAASPSEQLSLVLDALTAVLQLYGRHAPDAGAHPADDTRELFSQWARHASLGVPAPGQPDSAAFVGVHQRQWRALVNAFGDHRRAESLAVGATVHELRDTVWAFVGAMHGVVREEHETDRAAATQLDRVRDAVADGSPDRIRREALATVELLNELARRRRERQREQFSALAERLARLNEELEQARRESATDPLTGLANRRALDEYAERIVAMHALTRKPSCLLMIDLDHFKAVNDSHGHQAGDERLRAVASSLSRVFMRRCDFVCRYGGDEFVVILHETDLTGARSLAERLLDSVAANPLGEGGPPISISIGIAELAIDDSLENWIARADEALYAAKTGGRGQAAE
jgi:diguanylate cyclase (GGDEF)-like protein